MSEKEASYETRQGGGESALMKRPIGELQVRNLTLEDLKRLLGLKWAAEADLVLFARQCTRYDLDPFASEIYMLPFKDSKTGVITPSIVTAEKVFASRGMERLIELDYRIERIRNWAENNCGYFQIWVRGQTTPLVDIEVTLAEKSTGRGMWVVPSKQGIMLKKAARLEGWRLLMATPLYHPSELPHISEEEERRATEFFGEREGENEQEPGPLNNAPAAAKEPAAVDDQELAAAAAEREAMKREAQEGGAENSNAAAPIERKCESCGAVLPLAWLELMDSGLGSAMKSGSGGLLLCNVCYNLKLREMKGGGR